MLGNTKKTLSTLLVSMLLASMYVGLMGLMPKVCGEASEKLDVVILEGGIYDSPDVLSAINGYCESVRLHLGFECVVTRVPLADNSPFGIDALIERRYSQEVKLFILVGNDLKFPLSIWEDGKCAMPSDGVLCDTDHELYMVGDGVHQPISYFTAEVTISYVFPPKFDLSTQEQRNYVIQAFNKFKQYHDGKIAYNKKAVVCGHFNDALFNDPIDYMTSASKVVYGWQNTISKELDRIETIGYLDQALAFFGVAGHGSPQLIETNSLGNLLADVDLAVATKAPLLLEIFGCWTGGWYFRYNDAPWSAEKGYLTEAGILKNGQTIAMITGFPESGAEASYANAVLQEIPFHPQETLGELMIGQKRRSTDWIFYGDPAAKLEAGTSTPTPNQPPEATITSITPNPAEKGTAVTFRGSGTDSDGQVISYKWISSLDGVLSNSASFSSSTLTVGTHYIYFQVQDNEGAWSNNALTILTITAPSTGQSVTITSPLAGAVIQGTQLIKASVTGRAPSFVNLYIDNLFKDFDDTPPYEISFDTFSLSNGQHTIQVKASFSRPASTLNSDPITVTIANQLPTVTIASPASGSTVSGNCIVEVLVTEPDKVSTVKFYVDGGCRSYDYSPPFQWNWDTHLMSDGQHTIRVEAYYRNLQRWVSSETVLCSISNHETIPHTVNIYAMFDIQKAKGTVTFNAVVTGENLRYIYFYVDGKWLGFSDKYADQFVLNVNYYSTGQHEMYAVGIYEEFPPYIQVKSAVIQFIVSN